MSNKHTTHKHGLTTIKILQPKSKLYKRRNKALAKTRKAKLWTEIAEKKASLEKQLGIGK